MVEIFKLGNCLISIDGIKYYFDSYIEKWFVKDLYVVVISIIDIMFLNVKTKEKKFISVPYTEYLKFSDFGEYFVIKQPGYLIICDFIGNPIEAYKVNYNRNYALQNIMIIDKYILIKYRLWNNDSLVGYVRENISQYLSFKTYKIFDKKEIQDRQQLIVNEISHSIEPDFVINDKSRIKDIVGIESNILTYISHFDENKIQIELPIQPKIKRESLPRNEVEEIDDRKEQLENKIKWIKSIISDYERDLEIYENELNELNI